MSELYEFYTERRQKHYYQRHQLLREGDYLRDPSCTECYPLIFEPKTYFKNFWKWYKNITPAETYSLYTVRQLEELVTDTIGIIEIETIGIQKKLETIIGSITYREKPDKTSKEIYQEILDRFTYSNRFELDNEEVEELLKSSDENSSEKEEQIDEELLKSLDENSSEGQIENTENHEENTLADGVQVNYFIKGLNPLYIIQIMMTAPANLNVAVTQIKLLETGMQIAGSSVMENTGQTVYEKEEKRMFKRIRIRLIGIKTILETGIHLEIQEGITLEMILGTEIMIQMWTNLQNS